MNAPAEDYIARGADPRVAAVEKDVVRVEIRTTALELWKNSIDISNAARVERDKHVDATLQGMRSDLRWLLRLVIGAIVGAVIVTAMKSGVIVP